MPNWCDATIEIVLPRANKNKFLDLFLEWDNDGVNDNKERYFARTFLADAPKEIVVKENDIKLSFSFTCAWSVWSCWVEGYPNEITCPTIEQICDELDIKELTIQSSELGMYFVEDLYYDQNTDGIIYECQELDKDLFIERLGQEQWDNYCYDNEYDDCHKAYEIYTKNYYISHGKDTKPVDYDEFYNNEWQDEILKEYYLKQINEDESEM